MVYTELSLPSSEPCLNHLFLFGLCSASVRHHWLGWLTSCTMALISLTQNYSFLSPAFHNPDFISPQFDFLSLPPASGFCHHIMMLQSALSTRSVLLSGGSVHFFFSCSPSAPLLSLFSPMKLLQCHQTARQPSGPCVMTMLKHLDPP